MKRFKEKKCKRCEEVFRPKAPAALYCHACADIQLEVNKKKSAIASRLSYRKKQAKLGRVLGYGKGSSNPKGKESPLYKNGIGYFHKVLKRRVKRELRYCQECGKDLIDASPYHWCCHHIDHNRDNNVRENLTLLCKSCHQIEHQCHLSFQKGATTIPKGSTSKRMEAQDTYDYCRYCYLKCPTICSVCKYR